MGKKKVLISGAGVAGIVCAILLDKETYDVELIERADTFRNIGFSLVLWKKGFDLLMSLLGGNGIHLEAEKDYFALKGFEVWGGNTLRPLKTIDLSGHAWAFEREHLMGVLQQALERHVSRERVRFSNSIKDIAASDTSTHVTFKDGSEKEYDFVIIAEGINSTSRELVPIDQYIMEVPYDLRYAWFATPTVLGSYALAFLSKGHFGVVHPPYSKNLFGFYYKKGLAEDVQTDFEQAALEHVRQPNGEPAILDLARSHIFDLKEVHMDSYVFRKIIFVGDAAHGHPPTLGFGTSLAIEDAVGICETLNRPETSTSADALGLFSKRRIKRVAPVYRMQGFVHLFITDDPLKVSVTAFLGKLFLISFIASRMKKLATASD